MSFCSWCCRGLNCHGLKKTGELHYPNKTNFFQDYLPLTRRQGSICASRRLCVSHWYGFETTFSI